MKTRSHRPWLMLLTVSFFVLMITGCWPENSIEWSADGRLGLVHVDDELWLVKDPNQAPVHIVDDDVLSGPALSLDGQWIAYVVEREVNELTVGLDAILPAQQRLLEQHTVEMQALVMDSNTPSNTQFPRLTEKGLEEGYRAWVVRNLCENADASLINRLGKERYTDGRNNTGLTLYDLYVATGETFSERRKLFSSLCPMAFLRFSPDAQTLAYMLAPFEKDVYCYSLCVTSLEEQGQSILIAENTACICDWHPSGQRLAYLRTENKNEKDVWWGILSEAQVFDGQEKLNIKTVEASRVAMTSHTWDGSPEELVGVLFNPWVNVEYGLHDRIFFSSVSLSLPCSTKEEPQWSIFCYDPLTASVTDILPISLQQSLDEELRFFSLSPNKRNLLIGAENVAIIALDRQREVVIIETGLDEHDIVLPAWRGNEQISCMLDKDSPLLKDREFDGDQLVLLDREGQIIDVFKHR